LRTLLELPRTQAQSPAQYLFLFPLDFAWKKLKTCQSFQISMPRSRASAWISNFRSFSESFLFKMIYGRFKDLEIIDIIEGVWKTRLSWGASTIARKTHCVQLAYTVLRIINGKCTSPVLSVGLHYHSQKITQDSEGS
jgi:hypothetical protein